MFHKLNTSDANDMLDLSPVYIWKSRSEIEKAQLRPQEANLIFTAEVSTVGPIFETINLRFESHCWFNNINFAPVRSVPGAYTTLNKMAWMLTGPKGRSTRTYIEDPKFLTRFTFTLQALRTAPFSNTPNNLGTGPFIFIVPTEHNLFATIAALFNPVDRIPDHVRLHTCFRRRVLHPILASLAGDPSPECSPSCAPPDSAPPVADLQRPLPDIKMLTDSDDDFPEPAKLIREIPTWSMRRQQWQDEAAATAVPGHASLTTPPFIPGPLLVSAMESSSTSVKLRSFLGDSTPLDLTLQHMLGGGSYSFSAWQNHILLPLDRQMDTDRIKITASSVDDAARTLITLCLWQFAGRPTGLKFIEVLHEQFPTVRPEVEGDIQEELVLLSVKIYIGLALGRGLRNEVVARALQIILADGRYWTEHREYQNLRLHPSRSPIPFRACILQATGCLFLLHFLFIGAPVPVSPFIFATLFDGRHSASKFDPEFLSHFLSAESLSLIKKIHSTPLDRPLYTSQSEDCIKYQYLLNIPEFDPTLISPRRSKEEHNGISRTLISFATLGSIDIEHHPDFLFVTDGFNISVDAFGDQDRSHNILKWFETPCRELVISTYSQNTKSVNDVVSHLDFTQTNPEDDPWKENAEIIALIRRFVVHYLSQPGQPADTVKPLVTHTPENP
ncbi:hypothetical protein C8R43DRAFT_962608 [Mycena crocata]|nr:hypothetical protein C8R43DRAFT_962608 [Mycena crocata]